jgi:hypothetical protein
MSEIKPVTIHVHGKPVILTAETIQKTREWFADNSRACIEEARSGETRVNNLESYIAWREAAIADSLAGKGDRSVAFIQRAYFIQSGQSIPLLG